MYKAYILKMILTDYMCQKEREEEGLPAMKIALMHR